MGNIQSYLLLVAKSYSLQFSQLYPLICSELRQCQNRLLHWWKRFFESSFGTNMLNVRCGLLCGLKSLNHEKMVELILFGKRVSKFLMPPEITPVQWISLMWNLYCHGAREPTLESWLWRNIRHLSPTIQADICYIVGNGTSTCIWFDPWIREGHWLTIPRRSMLTSFLIRK